MDPVVCHAVRQRIVHQHVTPRIGHISIQITRAVSEKQYLRNMKRLSVWQYLQFNVSLQLVYHTARLLEAILLKVPRHVTDVQFLPHGEQHFKKQVTVAFRKIDVPDSPLFQSQIQGRKVRFAGELPLFHSQDVNRMKRDRPHGLQRRDGHPSGQIITVGTGNRSKVGTDEFPDQFNVQSRRRSTLLKAVIQLEIIESLEQRVSNGRLLF